MLFSKLNHVGETPVSAQIALAIFCSNALLPINAADQALTFYLFLCWYDLFQPTMQVFAFWNWR